LRLRIRLLLVPALASALIPACGRKGPLQLPLVLVPQNAEKLTATQRGNRIRLEWTNPAATIDGTPIKGRPDIEIWMCLLREPPEPGETPPAAEEFGTRGRRIAVMYQTEKPPRERPGETPPAAVLPAQRRGADAFEMFYEYNLSGEELRGVKLLFSARVRDESRKRYSEFAVPAAVVPLPLPLPPSDLRAEIYADRIELRWAPPAANIDGSNTAAPILFNIYRIDQRGTVVRLNPAPLGELMYSDTGFLFGQSYRYLVRALAAAAGGFLESEDSPAAEILPKDVFPPAVPTGLSAATGAEFITLIWDANTDNDLAGYHVWRKPEGQADFVRLTTAIVLQNTYADRAIEKNRRYEYAISAVDALGNESAKSAAVSEIIKSP